MSLSSVNSIYPNARVMLQVGKKNHLNALHALHISCLQSALSYNGRQFDRYYAEVWKYLSHLDKKRVYISVSIIVPSAKNVHFSLYKVNNITSVKIFEFHLEIAAWAFHKKKKNPMAYGKWNVFYMFSKWACFFN